MMITHKENSSFIQCVNLSWRNGRWFFAKWCRVQSDPGTASLCRNCRQLLAATVRMGHLKALKTFRSRRRRFVDLLRHIPNLVLNVRHKAFPQNYIAILKFDGISQWWGGASIRFPLVKGKGKVVPVLNYVPRHEDVLGSVGIAPLIL
jgi:hypothetical protein